jgi:acyl-CoA dehydrogenase
VRVTSIYEGTNGIQALDLVGRKMMDDGAMAFALLDEMAEAAPTAPAELGAAMLNAIETLRHTTKVLLTQSPLDRGGAAVAYQRAFAQVLGAHFHLLAAVADPARLPLARFAITRLLPRHAAWAAEAREGSATLFDLTFEALSA